MGNKVMEREWPVPRLWMVSFWNKSNPLGGVRRMPGDCGVREGCPRCAGSLHKEEPWEETEARLPTTE